VTRLGKIGFQDFQKAEETQLSAEYRERRVSRRAAVITERRTFLFHPAPLPLCARIIGRA